MAMAMETSPVANLWHNIKNQTLDKYVTLGLLATGMVIAEVDPEPFENYARNSFPDQMSHCLQSTLMSPPSGCGKVIDLSAQLLATAGAVECGRRANGFRRFVGMAVVTGVTAGAVDAAVDHSGWLDPHALAQPDVGFSAINIAWVSSYLIYKARRSAEHSRRWWSAFGVFAGTTLGAIPALSGSEGKLELTSHGAGLIVGVGAALTNRSARKTAATSSQE